MAFPGPSPSITGAAFSGDGKVLATASGRGAPAGEVRLWDVVAGKEHVPRIGYEAAAFFGPTGEGDLLGLPASLQKPPGVEALAFSADGGTLATAFKSTKGAEIDKGTIKLWDSATGKQKAHIVIADRHVQSLTLAPDGKTLVIATSEKGAGASGSGMPAPAKQHSSFKTTLTRLLH